MTSFTVALAQVEAGRDVLDLAAEAAGRGADLLLLPEMYSNGYTAFDPDVPGARARRSRCARTATRRRWLRWKS